MIVTKSKLAPRAILRFWIAIPGQEQLQPEEAAPEQGDGRQADDQRGHAGEHDLHPIGPEIRVVDEPDDHADSLLDEGHGAQHQDGEQHRRAPPPKHQADTHPQQQIEHRTSRPGGSQGLAQVPAVDVVREIERVEHDPGFGHAQDAATVPAQRWWTR